MWVSGWLGTMEGEDEWMSEGCEWGVGLGKGELKGLGV